MSNPVVASNSLYAAKEVVRNVHVNENPNLPEIGSRRVTVLDQKGSGITTFQKVEITYSDGALFYRGWIQIFGDTDGRNGPTVFPDNYSRFDLDFEQVEMRNDFWDVAPLSLEDVALRVATEEDLDAIIDLRFQSYFDAGYERISAYQALNQTIESGRLSMVSCSEEKSWR